MGGKVDGPRIGAPKVPLSPPARGAASARGGPDAAKELSALRDGGPEPSRALLVPGGMGAGSVGSLGLGAQIGAKIGAKLGAQLGAKKPLLSFEAGDPKAESRRGAQAIYDSAKAIVAARKNPFLALSALAKRRYLEHLTTAAELGPHRGKASVDALRRRSGAATLLLSLARAAGSGEEKIRRDAIRALLDLARREQDSGLGASVVLNLKAADHLLLSAEKLMLGEIEADIFRRAPDYDRWFKGAGPHTLKVSFFIHHEFWGEQIANLKHAGYEVDQKLADGRVILSKTDEETGVTVRITARKSEDGIFRDMDEEDTPVTLYAGHSSLGGNVKRSLEHGDSSKGPRKFVGIFCCRGKQNLSEIHRKYPNADVLTTMEPSYDEDDQPRILALLDGFVKRKTYRQIAKAGNVGHEDTASNYLWPDDPRGHLFRDSDLDGLSDLADKAGKKPDPLFNVRPPVRLGERTDLVPSDDLLDPDTLDGVRLDTAVAFANTLFTYHAEDTKDPYFELPAVKDRFVSGGWFQGEKDEAVKFGEKKLGGRTFTEIKVNARFGQQSPEALAAMLVYELHAHLSKTKLGHFDHKDRLRGLVAVAETVHYLAHYRELSEAILSSVAERYDLPVLTHTQMERIRSVELEGYISKKEVSALEKHLKARV